MIMFIRMAKIKEHLGELPQLPYSIQDFLNG